MLNYSNFGRGISVNHMGLVDTFSKTLNRINSSSNPEELASRYLKVCHKYGFAINLILSFGDSRLGERYSAAKYIINESNKNKI